MSAQVGTVSVMSLSDLIHMFSGINNDFDFEIEIVSVPTNENIELNEDTTTSTTTATTTTTTTTTSTTTATTAPSTVSPNKEVVNFVLKNEYWHKIMVKSVDGKTFNDVYQEKKKFET